MKDKISNTGCSLDHYMDISFSKSLNPTGMITHILWRLHGFKYSSTTALLAVDFPDWKGATTFMGARIGSVLRIFGDKASLMGFLKETDLFASLIKNGVTLNGMQEVPEQIDGYVRVERNRRIERFEKLLQHPERISFHTPKAQVTDEIRKMAADSGIIPEHMAEIDRICNQLLSEKRNSVELHFVSKSNEKPFRIDIMRHLAKREKPTNMDFSTYGFSREQSAVPYWTGVGQTD